MCLLRTGLIAALMASGPLAAAVPPGFTDDLVTDVAAPTALAFTPHGRLLITTQTGTLRVYRNGALLPTPALAFPASVVCTESERGLLGVAVHPSFATNRYIYLFYTFRLSGTNCVNRVSRFILPDTNVIDVGTEEVLVDNMPSPNWNHNAGDLHFGKDGFLYISIGEGGVSSAARDEHVLTGKILRITADGGIPPTNPFQGPGTARCNVTGQTTPGNRCQETFAWGFRNPFRIAFDPNAAGTRFFINDVGQNLWEEIDEAQPGADYGWNLCEGSHTPGSTAACSSAPPGMVNPIYEYQHGVQVPGTTSPTNCRSITGGAFVPNGLWPGYDDSYLFSDFVCGWIFKLTNSGGTWTASDFATNLGGGSAVHLAFGPHGASQALYYTTYADGGQVRRISPAPQNVGPLDFFTVAPCRLVDTRGPAGPYGGPALAAGGQRVFDVDGGACGVPATAKAVAVNLTVAGATSGGHLEAFPADGAGTGTSVLNFAAGGTRANNAVLLLGFGGSVAVRAVLAAGSAHFLMDVVGYFE